MTRSTVRRVGRLVDVRGVGIWTEQLGPPDAPPVVLVQRMAAQAFEWQPVLVDGLLGAGFRITQHRGEVVESEWAGPVIPTVHPSSVLRAPDDVRAEARREFFRDIEKVAEYVRSVASGTTSRERNTSRVRNTSSRAKRGT